MRPLSKVAPDWGTAISHGCVNVNLTDAGWLYDWAPSGTKVVIHK